MPTTCLIHGTSLRLVREFAWKKLICEKCEAEKKSADASRR
jgi:hypothetical protein